MEIINQPCSVKAKKTHQCSWCNCEIQQKETYVKVVYKYEGCVFTWKSHVKCMDVMYDHGRSPDGSITANSFDYFINEVFEDVKGE